MVIHQSEILRKNPPPPASSRAHNLTHAKEMAADVLAAFRIFFTFFSAPKQLEQVFVCDCT